MAHFLFKTEPSSYAFSDLEHEKRARWDGVSNALALKHLRTVAAGDMIAIYHTGDEKAVVGIARATRAAYADPTRDDPKLAVVDIVPVEPLARPVTLAEFRADPVLAATDLVRLPRLSVMPVTAAQFERILKLGAGPQ
jgi:predicted RNA-binding protein with PUA-like domain